VVSRCHQHRQLDSHLRHPQFFQRFDFAASADIFHGRHFGMVGGLLLGGMGVGGVLGPWLGGYLFDISGSYKFAFALCMVSFVFSSLFFWIAAPRKAALADVSSKNGWFRKTFMPLGAPRGMKIGLFRVKVQSVFPVPEKQSFRRIFLFGKWMKKESPRSP
jgi:MFS family permease